MFLRILRKSIRSDILDKIFNWDSKNVSDSNHGDVEYFNTQKRLIYLNILKPNIALLPCYKNNIILIETSKDNPNYFDKMPTNTPRACKRFFQFHKKEGGCSFLPIIQISSLVTVYIENS